MAGGLPEPILISELVHLDHITIAGQTVEFRHVFYTWMAMLNLSAVGWLVPQYFAGSRQDAKHFRVNHRRA